MLELMGIPLERPAVDGQSLTPLMTGARSTLGLEAYAEAVYPRYHFGWSDLRTLRAGRFKYIEAPRPELYDLETGSARIHERLCPAPRVRRTDERAPAAAGAALLEARAPGARRRRKSTPTRATAWRRLATSARSRRPAPSLARTWPTRRTRSSCSTSSRARAISRGTTGIPMKRSRR